MAPNDVPESVEEVDKEAFTPKQSENWENHGKAIVEKLETDEAIKWYLRTYRPKKRGSGMMEREHVQIGEPEHYFKKQVEHIINPMGSFQGLIMANFGIDEDTIDEIDTAAVELVFATTNKIEAARIKEQNERVARLYGV